MKTNWGFTFLVLFVLGISTASAGVLTVKVTRRIAGGGQGTDLADATVCVFNASTFEQTTTNNNGKAIFQDFLAGEVIRLLQLKAGSWDRVFNLTLADRTLPSLLRFQQCGTEAPPPPPPPPTKPDLVVHLVQVPENPVSTEDTIAYGISYEHHFQRQKCKNPFPLTGFKYERWRRRAVRCNVRNGGPSGRLHSS